MKKICRLAGIILMGAFILGAAGCGGGKADLLAEPKEAVSLSQTVRQDVSYIELQSAAEQFAARFAPEAVKLSAAKNTAVSPISVYMALSLAAECASNDTRDELQQALFASHELTRAQIGNLYCGLNAEFRNNKGRIVSKLALGNSIWIQKDYFVKENCTKELADKYYCYSYSADFANDNKAANKAVQRFVRDQTNGMIDQDFNLSLDTRIALINSLYLKDVWNYEGDDLSFTENKYEFRQRSGEMKELKLMQGKYISGRAYQTETFRHFYTETQHGYKLKFFVPTEGHTLEEIFTADNLALVSGMTDYSAEDDEHVYYTRCLFPEFKTNFDEDIKETLKAMGVRRLFDSGACQFGSLTDEDVFCAFLRHVAKLNVEKSGIEGAAVTVVEMNLESAPDFEYQKEPVYLDFCVDKAFGFVFTDRYGTTLFAGTVGEV